MIKEFMAYLLAAASFSNEAIPRTPAATVVRGSWGLKLVDAEDSRPGASGDCKPVIVAVIDTGADINHPDLKDAIWTNPGETGRICEADTKVCDRSTNAIDDDGNGFIDDVHGWNFAQGNAHLIDRHGHGTHIAGIIAATGQSALRGVAPEAKLMILKYFDPKLPSGDPVDSTVRAIEYAVKMGARIINYSAGGKRPSQREKAAIRLAAEHGVLFVAAAGNEGSDSDVRGYYPADYDLPNILSVTAVDARKQILPTSNFGSRSVQVAAPGDRILSTLPDGKYGLMTGTSQATAFASGVAALLLAHRSGAVDPAGVALALALSGEAEDSLRRKTRYQTILNAKRAIMMHDRSTAASGLVVNRLEAMDAKFLTPNFGAGGTMTAPLN